MAVAAGWVDKPKYKKGLDPLGVQQPCIAIYASLLPGITNVTDRIAYFGFGPWFTWSFAQRHERSTVNESIEMLRRAEVLLTLISVRHAITTADGVPDQHDGAMVGVDTLRSVVSNARADKKIRLSEYATLNKVEERYFKNRRGGLGQYYLGVLRDEYQLLGEHENRLISFTLDRGEKMASAVASGVDSNKFFQCVESDRVSLRELDTLFGFCPCQLKTKRRLAERTRLLETVLGLNQDLSKSPKTRRQSLALIIDFLRASAGCAASFVEDEFLAGCYTRVLPNGNNWPVPGSLVPTADLWAFYLSNELLSLAMQRLFKHALLAVEKHAPPVTTVEAAGKWCVTVAPFAKVNFKKAKTYDDLFASVRSGLPAIGKISNTNHELELWRRVSDKSIGPADAIEASIRLILTVVARHGAGTHRIERAIGANGIRLEHYPINFDTVVDRSKNKWPGTPLDVWLADTLSWILGTHRQVALRKLSQSGDDTRRLRMGDDRLYVDGDQVDVARTVPRLRQAFRFLRDLGLTDPPKPGHFPVPTSEALNLFR
jgi:hypothetical protein